MCGRKRQRIAVEIAGVHQRPVVDDVLAQLELRIGVHRQRTRDRREVLGGILVTQPAEISPDSTSQKVACSMAEQSIPGLVANIR